MRIDLLPNDLFPVLPYFTTSVTPSAVRICSSCQGPCHPVDHRCLHQEIPTSVDLSDTLTSIDESLVIATSIDVSLAEEDSSRTSLADSSSVESAEEGRGSNVGLGEEGRGSRVGLGELTSVSWISSSSADSESALAQQ